MGKIELRFSFLTGRRGNARGSERPGVRGSQEGGSMDVRLFALDIAAICALAFALYYPRHRRKDLAVALVGVNVGVLAVTMALSTATVGAGLGLGLFGVLSIIRLRSSELSQVEVAYYFAALAIGLIGGVVLALGAVDSSRVMSGSRHMAMVVDRAIGDADELARFIEARTGMAVREVSVVRLDYVNDSTTVDVRCGGKAAVESARPRNLRAA